jgi:ABC-2 type transport system ATP-binding protein
LTPLMSDLPAIEVHSLRKVYNSGLMRQRSIEALKGVSLKVRQGEVFGLLGPNGAGKTTFIKILLGIIGRTGGEAKVLGHPAGSIAARQNVGYLPENMIMPRHLTGYTAMEYYGNLSNLPTREVVARRDKLLELVGLRDRARDRIGQYSKGMLQRLGLAQAMLHEPKLLLLDEPTDGLDPVGRVEVRATLTALKNKGATVFLNSHLLQEVELVCDRVAILDRGELRYLGAVRDIEAHVRKTEAASRKTGAKPARTGVVEEVVAIEAVEAVATVDDAPSGLEVDMQLAGDERAVRSALAGQSIANWQQVEAGQFSFTTRTASQADVDRLVDALRRAGVSIVGLSRRRLTLEAAFMQFFRKTDN